MNDLIIGWAWRPFDEDEDDSVADDEAEEGEEVDKEEEGATVELVENRRVDTVEFHLCLLFLEDDFWICFNDHVGCALVEIKRGVF